MKYAWVVLGLSLAACGHASESAFQQPRPLLKLGKNCMHRTCTAEYDPLCAQIQHNNGRLYEQTFGNRCLVCVEGGEIISLKPGACGAAR